MPQTPHLSQLLKKYFSELVELKPRPQFFPRKVPIWGSFCGMLPIIQHFCPTWPMLSPIAKLSLQIVNCAPNLEFAATTCKMYSPPDECCPQMRNLVSKSEIGRPIWNLGTQK